MLKVTDGLNPVYMAILYFLLGIDQIQISIIIQKNIRNEDSLIKIIFKDYQKDLVITY